MDQLEWIVEATKVMNVGLAKIADLAVSLAPDVVPPPNPGPGVNPPAPTGGDDTQLLQSFIDANQGKTIKFDPTKIYTCNRELRVLNATIEDANIKAGPEGTGIGGAHPYRNIYAWNCPTGSTARFHRCNVKGRNSNTTAGDTPGNQYDAEREAQHAWNVEGAASFEALNCSASEIWGDGIFLGPDRNNTPCRNVLVEDFNVSKTGRQGMALTGVDGFIIRRGTTANMRRSCVDIEPLLDTYGMVRNGLFEDCTFGPGRLLVMAGKGQGINVSNVTWRRCKSVSPTGTPILQLGASNATSATGFRTGFRMEDCVWDVGGSPAGAVELVNVDDFTMIGCKFTFPKARAMTAVKLVNSKRVTIQGCSFTGAAVMVQADATSQWVDGGDNTL